MKERVIIAALAIAAVVGCSKDDGTFSGVMSGVEATFEASQIATRTTANTWENLDQVGIYMYQNGATDSSYSLARENVLYTSDASGNFKVGTSVTPIYYPQSDQVDFYAYYPHQATLAQDGYYTADITLQNTESGIDQGAVDFLTASLTEKGISSDALSFEFDHRLAMLTLVVTPKSSISTLKGVGVTLGEMNTQATFSTLTGELIASSAVSGSIEFLTVDNTTDAQDNVTKITATAIVLPEALGANAKVTFKFSETLSHSASFPTNTSFTAGMNHTYNVSVGYSDVSFEGESTINGWGSTTIDGIIDAEEDK